MTSSIGRGVVFFFILIFTDTHIFLVLLLAHGLFLEDNANAILTQNYLRRIPFFCPSGLRSPNVITYDYKMD